jgi:hypothetical protein
VREVLAQGANGGGRKHDVADLPQSDEQDLQRLRVRRWPRR